MRSQRRSLLILALLLLSSPAVITQAANTCPPGQYVEMFNPDGSVVCATAVMQNSAPPSLTAGTGLVITSTNSSNFNLAVDTAAIQRRVTGSCTTGQKITAIAADGSVTCANDPAYTAGAGLTLTGTTFSVPAAGITSTLIAAGAISATHVVSTAVQLRVTGSCTTGQKITAIVADGSVTCNADADTTYTAGAGLTLTGTTFSTNTAVTQARITGSCPAGQYVRAVNADGSVTCGADATGDTFPTGTVVFMLSGVCPSGWSEATALHGRAIVGLPGGGTQGGTYGTALTNQSARNVTLSTANMPAHTHDVNPAAVGATVSTDGGHTHTVNPAAVTATTTSAGAHTHNAFWAQASGGTTTALGGLNDGANLFWSALLSTAGAHTHDVTVDIPPTASDTAGAHTHTVTVDVPNTTSTSAGSGTAFDVAMPYIQLLACSKN